MADITLAQLKAVWDAHAKETTLAAVLAALGSTLDVSLTGSNVEQENGEDAAEKSNLVAGKTAAGKQVPVKVDEDGKIAISGTVSGGGGGSGEYTYVRTSINHPLSHSEGETLLETDTSKVYASDGTTFVEAYDPDVPSNVTISGSNTRKTVSASLTIGTGAAHAAGDVVSTDAGEILQFDTGLAPGASGIILDILTMLNQNAVFAGGAGYTLHLFTVYPTAQATNAVFDLDSQTGYIGSIDVSALVNLGSNCAASDKGINLSFTLDPADIKLYGKAACKGAETTVSGAVLNFNLGIAAL